jgi:hypothetical protein
VDSLGIPPDFLLGGALALLGLAALASFGRSSTVVKADCDCLATPE